MVLGDNHFLSIIFILSLTFLLAQLLSTVLFCYNTHKFHKMADWRKDLSWTFKLNILQTNAIHLPFVAPLFLWQRLFRIRTLIIFQFCLIIPNAKPIFHFINDGLRHEHVMPNIKVFISFNFLLFDREGLLSVILYFFCFFLALIIFVIIILLFFILFSFSHFVSLICGTELQL